MPRRLRIAAFRTTVVAASLLLINLAHRIKWPAADDQYAEAARGAKMMLPSLCPDSVTGLAMQGLPEDLYLYFRYCLIPARTDVQILPGRKTLLLVPKAKLGAVSHEFETLHQKHSELMRWEGANVAIVLYQL